MGGASAAAGGGGGRISNPRSKEPPSTKTTACVGSAKRASAVMTVDIVAGTTTGK